MIFKMPVLWKPQYTKPILSSVPKLASQTPAKHTHQLGTFECGYNMYNYNCAKKDVEWISTYVDPRVCVRCFSGRPISTYPNDGLAYNHPPFISTSILAQQTPEEKATLLRHKEKVDNCARVAAKTEEASQTTSAATSKLPATTSGSGNAKKVKKKKSNAGGSSNEGALAEMAEAFAKFDATTQGGELLQKAMNSKS
ncbi:hypothetical protein G7Y89_g13369 [Cudoniella acicularis]|uniref:Uncharacterized protein n=1 Tax=Cudoniella acicularis TaxID=354080 RepID=A0A8H4RAW0_9HELO|nr:hypothetical protein G7Y89_g13369 [Cudoniella acicularis]